MLRLSLLACTIAVTLLFSSVGCPPVNPTPATPGAEVVNDTLEHDPVLNLEYHKYLREIVNILETDPEFKKIIDTASADDIKTGKIAQHLDLVGHNIRTKLDELKRQEIERLRKLIQRKVALTNLKPHEIEQLLPKHVDHENIETFEVKDLEKLIQKATFDLEEVDRIRREEFKQHEMQKEFERRQKLEKLDPEARKRAEAEHQKIMEEKKHHEKLNHPGSKDQLEEVWREEDHLKDEKFDPETFFQLRDIDGNGYLDEFEIEAMFQHELDKVYKEQGPEYDPNERIEETNRMREHVFNEIDKDKDRMISKNEFLDATNAREFEKNEGWKSIEDEPQFDQKEFDNFSNIHTEEPHTQPTPVDLHQNQQQQHNQQQPPESHH